MMGSRAWAIAATGAAIAVSSVFSGCGSSTSAAPAANDYYFTGMVYDGASGSRITSYSIGLQYLNLRMPGSVASDGSYFVGPLAANNDFTIAIQADGYRPFLSHNSMLTAGSASYWFDAYLFPTALQSPAVTFYVTATDTANALGGEIRLQPMSSPATAPAGATGATTSPPSSSTDEPAGVASQVWGNDDDLQFSAVEQTFTGGQVTFAAGALVYGVTYQVNIFNVDGQKPLVGSYTAGVAGDSAFVLSPASLTPLAAVYNNTQAGALVPSGQLLIVFNEPAEFDPTSPLNNYVAAVDQSLSIDSPDVSDAGVYNTLKPASEGRGTTMTLSGNQLQLQWDPTKALQTSNSADPIVSVSYGGFDDVMIRAVGGTTSVSLASLVGSSSIAVAVSP